MPRRSGRAPNVHWTNFSGGVLALSAGTTAILALAAQHGTETLMRMRGNLAAWLDATQAPGGFAQIGVGMILVPEGTGTTVLWSPVTDGDAPWIWVEQFSIGYEEYVTDVIDSPGISSFRAVIDNKAMRVSRNQELQIVWENVTVGGAVSINGDVVGRVLSQE